MPWTILDHTPAFNQNNQVGGRISSPQNPKFGVQVVMGNIENPLEAHRLHFSEQYLTFSQSLAHFLRHSKARPHRSQILGSKPFLRLGVPDIVQLYIYQFVTKIRHYTDNSQVSLKCKPASVGSRCSFCAHLNDLHDLQIQRSIHI